MVDKTPPKTWIVTVNINIKGNKYEGVIKHTVIFGTNDIDTINDTIKEMLPPKIGLSVVRNINIEYNPEMVGLVMCRYSKNNDEYLMHMGGSIAQDKNGDCVFKM